MSKRKDGTVGPWAREKLDALARYLGFYTKVLKNQGHWCKGTIYVDAFAGPGRARVRTRDKQSEEYATLFGEIEPTTDVEDVAEFVEGSPQVALALPDPFTRYIFIERDPKRVAELEALRAEYGAQRTIEVREGDANTELHALLSSGIDWRHYRSVVFLDPFGMHVPWETIEALGKTRAIEVLINFPMGMAIQRLLVRSGDISLGWQTALDKFFGSPDWRDHAYEQNTGLFGLTTLKLRDSGTRLLDWYRARLKKAFGNVSTARLIKNTQGGHLYYLVWAGPHGKGLEGADYILSKGEKLTPQKRGRTTS